MSNSVFPYVRLRGWREALLLCCVVIPLVWFHDFSLPQLFGPELSIPVFLPNLVPGWETVGLISAHSIVAIGCAAAIGGRWGSAVSLRVVPLLSLTLCLSPWFVGENTALGNSVGIGTSPAVLIGEAVLGVIGLVVWVRQGR